MPIFLWFSDILPGNSKAVHSAVSQVDGQKLTPGSATPQMYNLEQGP